MRICVIGGTSLGHMPYLRCYEEVLQDVGLPYDLVYWDRFDLKESKNNAVVFRRPTPLKRAAILAGYAAYRRFLMRYLNAVSYDMYIVLGTQVAVLLYDFLTPRRFILDVRDFTHEGLLPYRLMFGSLLGRAELVCISSEGFKEWLPFTRDYIFSPNLTHSIIAPAENPFEKQTRIISWIGVVGYGNANLKFIDGVCDMPSIELRYIGEGPCDGDLQSHCAARNAQNVGFYGRFSPWEKRKFYSETNFVLGCYGNDGPLVKTALPNRLYESCMYYRPIIVNTGTYLAEVVLKNHLGIVVELGNMSDLVGKIAPYYDSEYYAHYVECCDRYLGSVRKEISVFGERLKAALAAGK